MAFFAHGAKIYGGRDATHDSTTMRFAHKNLIINGLGKIAYWMQSRGKRPKAAIMLPPSGKSNFRQHEVGGGTRKQRKRMTDAWNEIISITNDLYRSQLDGINTEKVEKRIIKAENNEHELLVAAIIVIIELRNKG